MKIIIGLIFTVIFYLLTAKSIKKTPIYYYLGAYAAIALTFVYYTKDISSNMPWLFNEYFMEMFKRGVFSTTTFIVVMYLGVFTKHNALTKKLFSIRAEMSIIGCMLAIAHNIIYGVTHFVDLFTQPSIMPTPIFISAILSLISITLMLPLWITSFKSVRKKMKAKSWKKLQRLAYPFFILIYVHVMFLYSMMWRDKLIDIIAYSIIFIGYIILRLRKYMIVKNR